MAFLIEEVEHFSRQANEQGWVSQWRLGAISPRELVYFLACCRVAGVTRVIESGRQDGVSTGIIAEALQPFGVTVASIDWEADRSQAEECRNRLAGMPNLELIKGDAAEEIPRLIAQSRKHVVALLIDGPKNFEALALLFAAAQSPTVRILAEHNLSPGKLARQKLEIISSTPCFFENETFIGPYWGKLGAQEDERLSKLSCRYQSEWSTLGVVILDETQNRAKLLNWNWHFGLCQPRVVDHAWQSGRESSVKRLLAIQYRFKGVKARMNARYRELMRRLKNVHAASRGTGLQFLTRVARAGDGWRSMVGKAKRGVIAEYLEYMREQFRRIDAYRTARQEGPVFETVRDRSVHHRITPQQAQFMFASNVLTRVAPKEVHDIASHRDWLIGVGAGFKLHTLDVRDADVRLLSEQVWLGRAEELPWSGEAVECLTSLCSIEHFGLGAYGDPFDPDGDFKAISEMIRVLRPGGSLVLTTTVNRTHSFTTFNIHRIYGLEALRLMFADLEIVEERYFSMRRRMFITEEQIVSGVAPRRFDLYMLWARKCKTDAI
jgi:hypothetical protein